jgi:4-aminobutyrate aminotransferase-like enzyme/Ser/Thr protein kinase RdoA (MazF antagonist)
MERGPGASARPWFEGGGRPSRGDGCRFYRSGPVPRRTVARYDHAVTADHGDVLAADPPALTVDLARQIAHERFGVAGTARALVSERDQNFAIDDDDGSRWVLKISNAAEDPAVVDMEVAAVERIAAVDSSLPVPLARPSLDGTTVAHVEVGAATHLVRLIPLLPGRNARPEELDAASVRGIGEVVARVGRALRGFFHPAAGRVIWWDQQHLPGLFPHAALIADPARRALLERVIDRFEERVVPALPVLRAQVIHNDVTLDNLLLDGAGAVTGIIDFGDMAHTALVLDVPATLQSLFRERHDIFEVASVFLEGYTSVIPLENVERELLGDLLAGRMAQTILISAQRTRQYPDNAYIQGWSEPAWALLELLEATGWDESSRRLASAARPPARKRAASGSDEALVERRERVLGSALEPMTYAQPLHLVRGDGAWMEDRRGRRYLDAYNNVPVVGHAHPRVVEAIARQAALLNTNTRYLHEHIVELAERLTASMPDGLDTVLFVNSGSEANDLAWRLATTVTGADTGIVTEWAYHGVTHAIADFSPSEWPRGVQPAAVETYPAPDTFRGIYADAPDPAAVAQAELGATLQRIADRGRSPAALFVDATFTSDGIFVPPRAVVQAVIGRARDAGALYVADEVQAGYGRTGDGLWGFEAWGVTPDVVTLGKPMGNGHPIAALVTRSDLVDRFAEQTTFFSTFGGNPVACAAGLAVLDVIQDEGLVANAAAVGDWLRARLAELAASHAAVGDVRGRGLMIAVELVGTDGTPAPELATEVKEGMARRGVLIGTSGRRGTVLKIRPPLCITRDEARLIVDALDDVLD